MQAVSSIYNTLKYEEFIWHYELKKYEVPVTVLNKLEDPWILILGSRKWKNMLSWTLWTTTQQT
jgi:hypothetical protein